MESPKEDGKEYVLIVDDEPRNVRIIRKALEKKYPLLVAENGLDALEKVEQYHPAIILLDIMMEGMDGYEVCRRVKADPEQRLAKILLVSGKAMVEERLKGYEVGANDYITKPFVREELDAKVKVFLDLYRAEKELAEINQSLEKEIHIRTEQLMRSERMAFVGMNSAEIVHNLKNPLAIINGYTQIMRKKTPDDKLVNGIVTGVHKLEAIIKSILDGTKVSYEDEKREIDINKLVMAELDLIKMDKWFAHEIELELDLHEGLSMITGVPNHYAQVLGNIISNAKDAMFDSEKKHLRIQTEDLEDRVRISITDSGSGIDPANIDKIFEPLYSTKEKEPERNEYNCNPTGTGLGLPYCKRMIEIYGGTIDVKTKLNEGTTFVIEIPVGEESHKSAA